VLLRIGLDDTDSYNFGCTTYIATCIIEELVKSGYKIVDFPYLVRLNPNIPYKTRGNGAVSFTCEGDEEIIGTCIKFLKRFEFKLDKEKNKPQPVIAFYSGKFIPNELKMFYQLALIKEVNIDSALKLAKKHNVEYYSLLEGERGLIGALASIGADLSKSFTYELLAYRNLENTKRIRDVSYTQVEELDKTFYEYTFGNLDYKKKRILITPHGNDPVFVGIRGYDPDILVKAFYTLKSIESQVTKWIIFKSNQGTDAHLKIARKLQIIEPYAVFNKIVRLIEDPMVIKGGHTILKLSLGDGKIMEAVAYSQSGYLSKIAKTLKKGDIIRVGGGINKHGVINIEQIELVKLSPVLIKIVPYCPFCGNKMESEGDGKGIRCKSCENRSSFKYSFLIKQKERHLREGLIILPDPRSRRHLTSYIEKNQQPKIVKFNEKYYNFALNYATSC